jgi:hypothetical protein
MQLFYTNTKNFSISAPKADVKIVYVDSVCNLLVMYRLLIYNFLTYGKILQRKNRLDKVHSQRAIVPLFVDCGGQSVRNAT